MANPLSDHHVIVGVALVAIGVFGVLGSVTGRLAPMIAGLFDPSDLTGTVSSGGSGNLVGNASGGTVLNVAGAGPSQTIQGSSLWQGITNFIGLGGL